MKKIQGFNYYISREGTVYNQKRQIIKSTRFKGVRYVRLYKNGIRHSLSISKILIELYDDIQCEMDLKEEERAFKYKDTNYYITNHCRVYNSKFNRWVEPIYRNGYPTINISIQGRVQAISVIKFLKSMGGNVHV